MNQGTMATAVMIGMMGHSALYQTETKPLKDCLNPTCSNKHDHNNAFCSSDCHKAFKALKKVSK